MKFIKIDSIITDPSGKRITGPLKELFDEFGTNCANKGFWYGVGAGIFWVGCGVLGLKVGIKLGKIIGDKMADKIVKFNKKNKADA